MAYKKPQQRKKEESKRLRGERERDRSSLLILELEDGKLQDSGKQEGKTFHKLHVLEMNEDLWVEIVD